MTEMGRARGTYVGQERCIQNFSGGHLRKRDHFEYPGADRRIILKWIFKNWDGRGHGLD
jgi:hypothetical protein